MSVLYAEGHPVLERFRVAAHAGDITDGHGVYRAREQSPADGAVLCVAVKVEAGGIREARFRAYGCPAVIAAGEWLADWLEGRQCSDLATVTASMIDAALALPAPRRHCALLAESVAARLASTIAACDQ